MHIPGCAQARPGTLKSASKLSDGRDGAKPNIRADSDRNVLRGEFWSVASSPSSLCPLSGRGTLDHAAEKVPGLAGPAHQLELANRMVVGRASVDADARQQDRVLHVVQTCRLLQHVLTRQ